MNIVLYEPEHFELLDAAIAVFSGEGRHLHVLISEAMQQESIESRSWDGRDVTIHRLPAKNSAHPAAVKTLCRQTAARLLVLQTVAFRHWQFANLCQRLRPKVNVCLGVHDINDLFAPLPERGLRGLLRVLGRKRLRQSVDAYLLLLDEMRDYLRTTYHPPQPLFVLPGSFYNPGGQTLSFGRELSIAVAGSIDTERRDYGDVEALARSCFGQLEDPGIRLQLLGTATGRAPRWLDSFPGVIRHDAGGYSMAEYESALEAAELIWLPLRPIFRRSGHPDEQYGISKCSGVFFDAVRHGKPLLLPDGLPVPEFAEAAMLRYSDATYLRYLLLALQANPSARRRLQATARASAARTTITSVRARIAALLPAGR